MWLKYKFPAFKQQLARFYNMNDEDPIHGTVSNEYYNPFQNPIHARSYMYHDKICHINFITETYDKISN